MYQCGCISHCKPCSYKARETSGIPHKVLKCTWKHLGISGCIPPSSLQLSVSRTVRAGAGPLCWDSMGNPSALWMTRTLSPAGLICRLHSQKWSGHETADVFLWDLVSRLYLPELLLLIKLIKCWLRGMVFVYTLLLLTINMDDKRSLQQLSHTNDFKDNGTKKCSHGRGADISWREMTAIYSPQQSSYVLLQTQALLPAFPMSIYTTFCHDFHWGKYL